MPSCVVGASSMVVFFDVSAVMPVYPSSISRPDREGPDRPPKVIDGVWT